MLTLSFNGVHSLDKKVKKRATSLLQSLATPSFVSNNPDVSSISKIVNKHKKKNVIVVGNGGSIQSFRAFAGMLAKQDNWALAHTPEPDFLNQLKKKFSPKDTLIIPVSKSGSNVAQLEAMFAFNEYPMLAVTGKNGTLWDIAEKLKLPSIEHPNVGGRYAGRTSAGLVPAAALGLDIKSIDLGVREMYARCQMSYEDNPAMMAAMHVASLHAKGYDQLFLPFYSTRISAFLPLLIQLIHESTGKDKTGITAYGDVAPESQHHTNQRFFGGPRNVSGLFFRVGHQDDETSAVSINQSLRQIKLRDDTVGVLDRIPYSKSLNFEYEGTLQDATKSKIPVMSISVDDVSARNAGQLLGFMQYFTVYLCELLKVNPYNQPQVETSKNISFELRKKFSRL